MGCGSKRPLCDVDIGVADERPSKSVAFEIDDAGGKLFSERCTLVGVSDAGQSFPSSSRPDDTDYGTSELESIARRRVGDLSGGRVCETAESDLPCFSGATVQSGLGAGRSKKKGELYRWSREGRPNPISPSGSDGGGYVFTEEMLEIAPFAKIFATGPENPLKNRHCFYCMICRRNVSMKSRGLY